MAVTSALRGATCDEQFASVERVCACVCVLRVHKFDQAVCCRIMWVRWVCPGKQLLWAIIIMGRPCRRIRFKYFTAVSVGLCACALCNRCYVNVGALPHVREERSQRPFAVSSRQCMFRQVGFRAAIQRSKSALLDQRGRGDLPGMTQCIKWHTIAGSPEVNP